MGESELSFRKHALFIVLISKKTILIELSAVDRIDSRKVPSWLYAILAMRTLISNYRR